VSAGGATGQVGLLNGSGFYHLQQDSTFTGNFPSGMGVIYNGASYGVPASDIEASFSHGVTGAGAYLQTAWLGPFTATITLYDSGHVSLGSYTTSGLSNIAGTALFIGAYIPTPDVWSVQFHAIGQGPHEPDFAIGTMGIGTSATPEPASLLFMVSGLAGLAAVAWRRRNRA
jgi:hypothetical protein